MTEALYIHIPFCQHICAYCDFDRCGYNEQLANKYLNTLQLELNNIKKHLTTIYIGGGTPNALSDSLFHKLLQMVEPFAKDIKEYTIELNVEELNAYKLNLIINSSINRVSLGVQTLDDDILKIIERKHTTQQVIKTINSLNEGNLNNISIDLIYGLPNQTIQHWLNDLKTIVKWNIKHISIYSLTIEENSKFGRNNQKLIDNTDEALYYELGIKTLEENGFKQYEIANFAKAGYESLHNQVYWKYKDFYGIGCGASGKINHQRYQNLFKIDDYINNNIIKEITKLTLEDEKFEFIMMNLRLRTGFNINEYNNLYNNDFNKEYEKEINTLINKNWITINNNFIKTTNIGQLLLHEILMYFMK